MSSINRIQLLVSMASSCPNPYYMLSDWVLATFPRLNALPVLRDLKSYRLGCGTVDPALFGDAAYQGEEFAFFLSGTVDGRGHINERRVDAYRSAGRNFPAFHGFNVNEYPSHRDLALSLADPGEIVVPALRAQIEVAARLATTKRPMFNIHVGAIPGSDAAEPARRDALRRVIANIRAVLPLLERYQMAFALENGFDVLPGMTTLGIDPWEFSFLFDSLDHPLLGMTYDWGHANVQGVIRAARLRERGAAHLAGYRQHLDFIEALGTRIVYTHLHYNEAHAVAPPAGPPFARWAHQKDQHAPLTRMPGRERGDFDRLLLRLATETGIPDHGFINVECVRRRVFGFLEPMPWGATTDEFLESADLVRRAFRAPAAVAPS